MGIVLLLDLMRASFPLQWTIRYRVDTGRIRVFARPLSKLVKLQESVHCCGCASDGCDGEHPFEEAMELVLMFFLGRWLETRIIRVECSKDPKCGGFVTGQVMIVPGGLRTRPKITAHSSNGC